MKLKIYSSFMFPFYLKGLRGKDRRGYGDQVLRAQVLRKVGSDKDLCS